MCESNVAINNNHMKCFTVLYSEKWNLSFRASKQVFEMKTEKLFYCAQCLAPKSLKSQDKIQLDSFLV